MILKAGTYRFNDVLSEEGIIWTPGGEFVSPMMLNSSFSSNGKTYHNGYLGLMQVGENVLYLVYMGFDETDNVLQDFVYLSNDLYDEETGELVMSKGWIEGFQNVTLNGDMTPYESNEYETAFCEYFIANTNYNEVNASALATIIYNGQTIAELNAGETATLSCEGKKMVSDVVVKVNEPPIHEGEDISINGIIEQYKVNAGKTVNAGDFVEFVSKYKSGTFCAYSVSYVSACKLDDSRVFIVYIRNSTMEAVVLTIDNGVTSVGTPVTISGKSDVSVTALSSNTVVVSYVQGTNSEATAIAIKIDGTTITAGESVYLDYMNVSQTKAVALTENKALIAFRYTRYNNDPKNYAVVVTVDDTTITKGTVVLLQNSGDFDIIALDESHLFFVAEYNDYISGYILTINDTTIISTSGFNLASGFYPKCTLLDTNKVLVAFCSSSISRAIIATVEFGENNQITRGTSSYEFSTAYFDNNGEVVALNKNKALVIYGNEGKCTILTIDGETITVGTEADFDANTVSHTSLLAFSENSALVVYNNSTGAFAGLTIDGDTITVNTTESGTFVQPATSRLHNVGVAKTSGAEGETVDVYCVG